MKNIAKLVDAIKNILIFNNEVLYSHEAAEQAAFILGAQGVESQMRLAAVAIANRQRGTFIGKKGNIWIYTRQNRKLVLAASDRELIDECERRIYSFTENTYRQLEALGL